MIDVEKTILSQYASSATIVALIHGMNAYVDPRADIDAFYRQVFDISTAEGYGLDVWGRIVDIDRSIETVEPTVFGFDGTGMEPFDSAPFFVEGVDYGQFELTDEQYRTLILLKAVANISACTSQSINQLLSNLFKDRGRCYVLDLGDMHMRYVFEFYLFPWERAIFVSEKIVIRPVGVGFDILEVDPANTFGFFGSRLQPFNQGVFSTISQYG